MVKIISYLSPATTTTVGGILFLFEIIKTRICSQMALWPCTKIIQYNATFAKIHVT